MMLGLPKSFRRFPRCLREISLISTNRCIHEKNQISIGTEKLNEMMRDAQKAQKDFQMAFFKLLEDRRSCYKDSFIADALKDYRASVSSSQAKMWSSLDSSVNQGPATPDITVENNDRVMVKTFSFSQLEQMKDSFLKSAANENKTETLIRFYTMILSSALIKEEKDIRIVLHHMKNVDLLEPTSEIYQSILTSLLFVTDVQKSNTDGKAAEELIAGEMKNIDRARLGDLAGHYFGAALSQHERALSAAGRDYSLKYVDAQLWGSFFTLCAISQASPNLMDLWYNKFIQWCDEQYRSEQLEKMSKEQTTSLENSDDDLLPDSDESSLETMLAQDIQQQENRKLQNLSDLKSPLPFDCVHALLSWSAASRDIERSLRFFREADKRGCFDCSEPCVESGSTSFTTAMVSSLTKKSNDIRIQQMQLLLLVKLLSTGKAIKMDGGLKKVALGDIKRLIDADVVKKAPWSVINDLLSGLSMPSAMKLIKLCSGARPQGDESVPFFIWASMLRRCAHEQHIDQAEGLFDFIRKRFKLDVAQKRELVEIMMRMYATLPTPDFSSTLNIFTEHVLRAPDDDPVVKPDVALYTILIKASDCKNASTMLFLEACADGVPLNYDIFEVLMGSNKIVSKLSRKLPHDYTSSELDSLLRIPSDVDAHVKREEALKLRNKPLYSSTGDSG